MTYENYLGFSREVLLEKMGQILPEKRLTQDDAPAAGFQDAVEFAQRLPVVFDIDRKSVV